MVACLLKKVYYPFQPLGLAGLVQGLGFRVRGVGLGLGGLGHGV